MVLRRLVATILTQSDTLVSLRVSEDVLRHSHDVSTHRQLCGGRPSDTANGCVWVVGSVLVFTVTLGRHERQARNMGVFTQIHSVVKISIYVNFHLLVLVNKYI